MAELITPLLLLQGALPDLRRCFRCLASSGLQNSSSAVEAHRCIKRDQRARALQPIKSLTQSSAGSAANATTALRGNPLAPPVVEVE